MPFGGTNHWQNNNNRDTCHAGGRKRVAKQAVEETGATLESEHKCNRRRANSTAERVRRSRAASQVRDTQRANQMYFPTVRRVCHGVLLQLYSFCCSVRMKYLLNESKIVEHYRQDSGKVLQHFVRPKQVSGIAHACSAARWSAIPTIPALRAPAACQRQIAGCEAKSRVGVLSSSRR